MYVRTKPQLVFSGSLADYLKQPSTDQAGYVLRQLTAAATRTQSQENHKMNMRQVDSGSQVETTTLKR